MNTKIFKNNLKDFLDNLVEEYETSDFIDKDPIRFVHMFEQDNDKEIAGILASCLAYGKREKIIDTVQNILEIIEFKPYEFAVNFNYKKDRKLFNNFVYRYNTGEDLALLFHSIGQTLKNHKSLNEMFTIHLCENKNNLKETLKTFVKEIIENLPDEATSNRGLNFLLPSSAKGSACKRLNMFLRWMVRKGPVDLNLWTEVPSSILLIPLDTHVAKLSRKMGLTERKADDWKTAQEITDKLKEFSPNDPAKYDFAIFGMGVYKNIPDFI